MKKFLVSVSLMTLSSFAMDNGLAMTTSERASLLESFRCGKLQVKGKYLEFADICDVNKSYARVPKDVHGYFATLTANSKLYADEEALMESLSKKSFANKISVNGKDNLDVNSFTIEEQEELLQFLVAPDFFEKARMSKGNGQLSKACKSWLLALELDDCELIAKTLDKVNKLRPEHESKPLNNVLKEDCAMQ